MSSSLPRQFLSRLNVRLFVGFSLLFVGSFGVIFYFAYSSLSHSLTKSDHNLIEAKTQEYAAIYEGSGLSGLQNINQEKNGQGDSPLFLLRLTDDSGKALFFHAPKSLHHFKPEQVNSALMHQPKDSTWQYMNANEDYDRLEVLTKQLGDGKFIQVGRNTDDRDDLLEQLRNVFLGALLLTILIAGLAGTYFSLGILAPIRNLISTIHTIQHGNLRARAEATASVDELQVLASLFNGMLDRIQSLMQAMQETQDNVAHDLRTPVTRFRSIAELALKGEPSPARYREAISEGLECSEEILTLINTLMEITEAEAGALRLDFKAVNLQEVIGEILDLYEMPAEDKEITLKSECASNICVRADRAYIKRVFSNLIDNAIKYTGQGGLVEIAVLTAQDGIKVKIKDNGEGIEPEDLHRIWDRLFRGDKSRSKQGLGLGLSVAQSIVKAHHGNISVMSESGKGSEFLVTLPSA
jgi:heavy metal sensor kinase